MKLSELRNNLKQELKSLNKDEADIDFLIAHVLKVNHTELSLISDISDEDVTAVMKLFEQRKAGKPVDKILGYKYFYGIKFEVNENVLSPRQDSEVVVDAAIKYITANEYKTMLDLCTGSGCLAVAIKRKTGIDVTAVDVSQKALTVAKNNAYKNNAIIKFVRSNMFENVEGKFDLIVSNPPYISSDEIRDLPEEVQLYDPILSLDGGDMGLKFYNIIHDNAKKFLNDGGMLILEIGDTQAELVESLFNDFDLLECIKDFNGLDRVMVFKK